MILGISGKIQELGNLFHSYVLGMMHPFFLSFCTLSKTLQKCLKLNSSIDFVFDCILMYFFNFFRQSHKEKVDVTHVKATNARLWFFQVHT